MPNNVNIINFVIKISGTIPPTVSRNESMAYVNGKYGEMFWKIVVSFELGMYPHHPQFVIQAIRLQWLYLLQV